MTLLNFKQGDTTPPGYVVFVFSFQHPKGGYSVVYVEGPEDGESKAELAALDWVCSMYTTEQLENLEVPRRVWTRRLETWKQTRIPKKHAVKIEDLFLHGSNQGLDEVFDILDGLENP